MFSEYNKNVNYQRKARLENILHGYHPIVDITDKCMYVTSRVPPKDIVNQVKQEFPNAQEEWSRNQFILKMPLYAHPKIVLGVLYLCALISWILFIKDLYTYFNSIK